VAAPFGSKDLVTWRTLRVICVFPRRLWTNCVLAVPLCGHRSYVAFREVPLFWRGTDADEGHITFVLRQSARRNAMMPLSSFHLRAGLTPFTSQWASAAAFISRSISA